MAIIMSLAPKYKNKSGYVMIASKYSPEIGYYNFILRYKYVYQQANREVPEGWVIHHINGKKDDDRLENLIAMSAGEHRELHKKAMENHNTLLPLEKG